MSNKRSVKKRMQLSIDPQVAVMAKSLARGERRSVSNMLEVLITRAADASRQEPSLESAVGQVLDGGAS